MSFRSRISWVVNPLAGVVLVATAASAQQPPPEEAPVPIQDNSFLIEEAYNQPAGVVQHISTFSIDRDGKSWAYGFTQEWPLFSQRHQLSYTLPVVRDGATSGSGVGDVALNYRYQMPARWDKSLAVAPRISVLLPTGEVRNGRGTGGTGIQLNLPVSAMISPALVTHFNAGTTYTPSAESSTGDRDATLGFNAGQSLIWLAKPNLNFMVELAWNRSEVVLDGGRRERSNALILAPGIRGAINFSSGLQVVPGIAVPLGIGTRSGERSLFFYVSFEHAFTKTAQ